jgi:hypothetical protein
MGVEMSNRIFLPFAIPLRPCLPPDQLALAHSSLWSDGYTAAFVDDQMQSIEHDMVFYLPRQDVLAYSWPQCVSYFPPTPMRWIFFLASVSLNESFSMVHLEVLPLCAMRYIFSKRRLP